MSKDIIQIVRSEKAKNLNIDFKQAHDGDAGWDIPVCWPSELGPAAVSIGVSAGEIMDIPSGIHIKLPEGFWAEIKARSSSFFGRKLHVHDAIIDNGYTGELKIAVRNIGEKVAMIADGERLAQMIIHRIYPVTFQEVEELPTTSRGKKEMGSSGK